MRLRLKQIFCDTKVSKISYFNDLYTAVDVFSPSGYEDTVISCKSNEDTVISCKSNTMIKGEINNTS